MEGKNTLAVGEIYRPLTVFASLLSGLLLLGTGFLAGWYWQNAKVQDVVKVEIVENAPAPVITPIETGQVSGTQSETPDQGNRENCQFVGSKNSDKYHSPGSAPAKRILPENIVCFASEAEAQNAGYEEGTIE